MERHLKMKKLLKSGGTNSSIVQMVVGLWIASGIFAYLGDEYYEWSMKCLRRSAWRQFKIAKMMLKNMKENPYKFPEE